MADKTKFDADTTKSCTHCKYCEQVVNAAQATATMFCRFNPPSSQGMCIGIDPNTRQPQWVYTTLWPMVTPSDFCGSFVRRLQS